MKKGIFYRLFLLSAIMRYLRPFRDAFIDAFKNTFNLSGRTSPKGFWWFVLPHFVLLFIGYGIESLADIHFPEWVWPLYFSLMGIPFIGLFFRRWHDISFSVWDGLFGIVLIFLFYFALHFDVLAYGVFFYFFIRFCQASTADNRYGPEPADSLTTCCPYHSRVEIFGILVVAAYVGSGLWVGFGEPGGILGFIKARKNFDQAQFLLRDLSGALTEGRDVAIASVFGLKDEKKNARVLLVPPYNHVTSKHLDCPGYSAAFFKELNARRESRVFDSEYTYSLIVFDSSGYLDEKILRTGLFCKAVFREWPVCRELNEALLTVDTEDTGERQGQKTRACYRLSSNTKK